MLRLRRAPLILAIVAVGAFGLACGGGDDEAPSDEDDLVFLFAEPRRVEVQRGDSLSLIAQREACTVDELRYWNALETDVIEPGQVLLVWDSGTGERARPKSGADFEAPQVAEAPPEPVPAPARSWNPIRRWVFGDDDDDPPAPAPAPVAAASPPVDDGVADASPRRAPVELRPAGVLGVDLEGNSPDLEASARGMQKHDSQLDGSGARRSAFEDGGTAETIEVEGRQPGDYGGVQIPNKPVAAPRLAMPSAKRCLSGPTEADLRSEEDMVGNRGLDETQIRAGMSKVVRSSSVCFPSGTSGTYSVLVELRVGCDGLVDDVMTVSAGPVPAFVTDCIEKTMSYAGFAAHGTPNGVSFQYPLKYTF